MSKAEAKKEAMQNMNPDAMSHEARVEVASEKIQKILVKYDLELQNTIMWAPQGAVPRLVLADTRETEEAKEEKTDEPKEEPAKEDKSS